MPMDHEVLPLLGPVHIRRDTDIENQKWHPRETYLSLDKGFGNVPAEQLVELAMQLEDSKRPHDLAVAGSAFIEATLFSPYRNTESLDEDIKLVLSGAELLQKAADAYWHDLERGFEHYDDQTDAIRAEIRTAYMPMYIDLLAGEVTDTTREEIYNKLAYWGRYTSRLEGRFGADGLAYEIATLMGGLTSEDVIVPSTPRADNGQYNEHATHDFTYLTLDDYGVINLNMPIELKKEDDRERRFSNVRRYSQFHVVMVEANKDLGLNKGTLDTIFSQQSLTWQARRNLTTVRSGLYHRVSNAIRQFGAEYNDAHSE